MQRDGYIYFALAPEVGRVKIGHTRDVPAFRIEELRTGCPVELVSARVIFGSVALERALHKKFADRRVLREWFEASVLDDVDDAVLEITGRRASPPRYPDLNPSRNPTPINTLSGFQGLSGSPLGPPSENHGISGGSSPFQHHRMVSVGGNALPREAA